MGGFIAPDQSLSGEKDLAAKLGVPIFSGYRALDRGHVFRGRDAGFDEAIERARLLDIACEDQCSLEYYFELWSALRIYKQSLRRIVEVGTYLGGSAALLAEHIAPYDCTLDLVDLSEKFLLFSYERIRRQCPLVADRVRLYCGDLPSYVKNVLVPEDAGKTFIHHDGSHSFPQVVKDLSALSFVRDKVTAVAIQDTHLRGYPKYMNFVDMAVYAVFGMDVKYVSIGAAYDATNSELVNPNRYQGNYFVPGAAEGWIIPFGSNTFKYPHPTIKLEEFL